MIERCKEVRTSEGAKLLINYAPFEEGLALAKAVNQVMLDRGLFGVDGKPSPEAALRLFNDPAVYELYLRCAKKAEYNGRHVDEKLFDDPKAGESASRDILEIFDEIVSFNVSRFFPKASSASKVPSPAA